VEPRLAAARAYVARKPADRFGLYTLALELKKIAAWEQCFATFETLLQHHPDYGPAHYHLGAARRESGDLPGARAALERGRVALAGGGDPKTLAEIEALLEEIVE
jgi:uncharacterized protein (DUF58 family)